MVLGMHAYDPIFGYGYLVAWARARFCMACMVSVVGGSSPHEENPPIFRETQMAALRGLEGRDGLVLLHGPPSTGKTYTVKSWLRVPPPSILSSSAVLRGGGEGYWEFAGGYWCGERGGAGVNF